MTATDIIAIIGSTAAAITLIINTWFTAKTKATTEEAARKAQKAHEQLNAKVDEVTNTLQDGT